MKRAARWAALLLVAIPLSSCARTSDAPPGEIPVVAAEDQYGSIVSAIGGRRVYVTSLLSSPNTDPHEFEASASTARAVSSARLVIENGLGYDAWMDHLLSASPRSGRKVITVGTLLGRRTGDNPHVWYMPSGWPTVARTVAGALAALDPAHRNEYRRRMRAWVRSLQPLKAAISRIRQRTVRGTVIATEPVYGYMLDALYLTSLDPTFGKAIMNGTDPSPQSVAAFQDTLKDGRAHLLVYNSQVSDPTTERMRSVADQFHVPQIGVTETKPPRMSFVRWQLQQLRAIDRAW